MHSSVPGLGVTESAPDHSTISRTRRRIDLETHRRVFTWGLGRLAESGTGVGQDGWAWMRRLWRRTLRFGVIVRRDTGEDYEEFVQALAEASGVATPTRAELARFDRKRKKKLSNEELGESP